MILKNILLVGFGGALGSVIRYLVGLLIKQNSFPYATITVNILGSFIIGLAMAYTAKQQEQAFWRLLLVTGFCGGFTTFSAISWEALQMLQQQKIGAAILYVCLSIILGLLAVFAGYLILK